MRTGDQGRGLQASSPITLLIRKSQVPLVCDIDVENLIRSATKSPRLSAAMEAAEMSVVRRTQVLIAEENLRRKEMSELAQLSEAS